ncbi:hypothetical protein [Clostridioides difficile]|uniref:hypothetical protein n=1 Tax=Clostridioides difficile TaxID=1496 RepID=UPI001F31C914|nr:hypothetical protein [Clostridioides difficile]
MNLQIKIQRLIEGLRTDPKIREMIFESKGCETRTSTRSKCEQFVEEKLAYRSYGLKTPKYYAKLIADIIDILVYKNVPRDRICGVLYDVERVIPLVVTF